MGELNINMKQFKERFKVYSDNFHIYEKIINSNGSFFTLDARAIIEQLCEFNIFYTFTA